jgi:alpha-L-fucosidase
MNLITRSVFGLSAALIFPASGTEPPKPHGAVPNLRQLRWHEMEMYAFAHFGPGTFNGTEWGSGAEKVTDFNPTDLDAGQVVRAAKAGGMKGLILTAKHHDGFCLWPSKFTEHCVRNSPWKNGKGDVVREFADACRRENMKFGVYISPWDRNHAEYGRAGYVEYYKNQIRELLTNYGPIFEMWFDGANGGDGYYGGQGGKRNVDYNTYYDWKGIRAIIRELQPDCAIWCGQYRDGDRIVYADCRWGGSEAGDVGDPCWNTMDSAKLTIDIPDCQHGMRHGDAWCGAEGDVSIRPGWFYHANQDAQVKSPERLMAIYQSCVGRGANLILNIPPDKRGQLHDNDVASLKLFGEHLEKTFADNLAKDAKPQASNVRGGDGVTYGPQKLTDADPWSAWITDDEVKTAEVVLELGKEQTFNLIRLREDIRLGQRVDEAAVDVWTLGAWKEVAKAQSIGAMRLWKIGETKTDKVRIRVTQAAACPAISDFGLFLEPPAPLWSANAEARAKLIDRSKWKISTAFENPGIAPSRAIDGDPNTFWHSRSETAASGIPASITLDMGEEKKLAGMTYLTRQDGNPNGKIDKYVVEASTDGKAWSVIAAGEFPNIQANPIEQVVKFPNDVTTRYLRLTAEHVVASDHITVAELGVMESDAK